MNDAVKNLPQIFYGLHFEPGVAQYNNGKEKSMVFISEETAKKMDPSMAGKPVVVNHIDGNLPDTSEGIKQIADGYVSESFYLALDGRHWAKFVAVTDKAKQAIQSGWKLSNAYKATEMGQSGKWHAVEYEHEILNGEYEHLAIVQHPRYESSIILTPEQFKQYCADRKTEIAKFANSADKKQQGEKSVLNIFKRTKVENSADINFDEMMVRLPKSGRELTLTTLVNEMDKFYNAEGYANPDHLVKVGNEEMSVKEMADCYGKMKSSMEEEAMKKKNAEEEEKKKNAEMSEEEKKKNAEEEEKKKKEMEDKKQNELEYERFKNNTNATVQLQNDDSKVVLPMHGVKRGLAQYGG